MKIKVIDLEKPRVLKEYPISAPPSSIWCGGGMIIVGLKTGGCEVWSISRDMKCKKVSESMVGRGESPIMNVAWVCLAVDNANVDHDDGNMSTDF
jgi:hypothetical protein